MTKSNVVKAILFSFGLIMIFVSLAFAQNTDTTEKPDRTLLKDGSEKAHIQNKHLKKTKTTSPQPQETPAKPATAGLPTDVD